MACAAGVLGVSSTHVTLAQFEKICLVIGRVVSVQENSKARIPAYLMSLDMGHELLEEHHLLHKKRFYTSSAQLCTNHTLAELQDSRLLCVANFARKQIGSNMSDCLVTGVQSLDGTAEEKRSSTVYMRPTGDVVPGSRVGLFGKESLLSSNARDLTWDEFTKADLRIGTVKRCTLSMERAVQSIRRCLVDIDFGMEGVLSGLALIREDFPEQQLLEKQVLVLTNLCSQDLRTYFGEGIVAVVCSVAGRVFLEPAKPVVNGFKLA